MPYKVKAWILVEREPEDEIIYETFKDARDDMMQAFEMQPENRYEIASCNEKGEEE